MRNVLPPKPFADYYAPGDFFVFYPNGDYVRGSGERFYTKHGFAPKWTDETTPRTERPVRFRCLWDRKTRTFDAWLSPAVESVIE